MLKLHSWHLSLHRSSPSLCPSIHRTKGGKKRKRKNILCWLGGSFTAPASVSTPFTGALPFYSGRFVLTQTAGSLASFFFSPLPDTICLHFKPWLKASGSVCLNRQINQATPPTSLGSIWIFDVYLTEPSALQPSAAWDLDAAWRRGFRLWHPGGNMNRWRKIRPGVLIMQSHWPRVSVELREKRLWHHTEMSTLTVF